MPWVMLKRKLRSFLRRLAGLPPAAANCWEHYGQYIRIDPTVIIDPCATLKIFNLPVPPRVCLEIGEGSHIFSSFALLRPEATIRIGRNCQLGASQFVCADSIEIGDDVIMAWGGTIMDTDSHALAWQDRKHDVRQCYDDYCLDSTNLVRNKSWQDIATRNILIANRSWIGFNVSILKGVRIGEEAVIGAGSVVRKSIPEKSIALGNPAIVVGSIR
jgi:acetyltransferase-like isoleucine patch superfamily enzyme